MSIVAEFVGGPLDGDRIALADDVAAYYIAGHSRLTMFTALTVPDDISVGAFLRGTYRRRPTRQSAPVYRLFDWQGWT